MASAIFQRKILEHNIELISFFFFNFNFSKWRDFMFYTQKGFFPRLTTGLGIIIPVLFFARVIVFLVPKYIKLIGDQSFLIVLRTSIDYFILFVLYLVIPVYLGLFLSGLFPSIYISKNGLEYKYLGGVVRKKILWSEIEVVKELKNGNWAILISRSGLPLLNGLYMNELYARLLRCGRPIILLSPNTDNFAEILGQIKTKTSQT